MKNDVKRVPKRDPNHSKNTPENSLEKQVKKDSKNMKQKRPGCTRKVGGISRGSLLAMYKQSKHRGQKQAEKAQ